MNKIAAIVVTYNRKILLKDCINKLKNQTIDSDIIIIDNGSTDGTESFIADLKENISSGLKKKKFLSTCRRNLIYVTSLKGVMYGIKFTGLINSVKQI